jgi:hypothetical protein
MHHETEEQAAMPLGWNDLLKAARTENDVVTIVRDFIATLEPQEVASLPAPCRPGKFFEADDVTDFAFALVQHDCGDDPQAAALVSKLSAIFSNASDRLSQILARSGNEESERQSA